MMGCCPSNAIAPSNERNHSGDSPDQRASEGGDKPQLTTGLHSSSKNSLNNEKNNSGDSPDQRVSEDSDTPQLTTGLHSSSKNSSSIERNHSGDSPDQRASEDSDTPQLTCTGLHSSSKNSSSDARYHVGDSPYQTASEGSDCDTPQLTTGLHSSSKNSSSTERNHFGDPSDQRALECSDDDTPQLTTGLHSSSKNSSSIERNHFGDSPDQRASEDSDTPQLTCTGLHSSSKNSSSDARYHVGDSPYQMASEGSDFYTPQLTTGLHSSSKNSSSIERNHFEDPPDQRASECSDGDTPQLTTGLHSSSKNSSSDARYHVGDPPELNKVLLRFADIKAITKPSKDANLPVDILLLTVTDCEFFACYSELKNPYRCWFVDLGYVYFSDVSESQEEMGVALLRCHGGCIGPGCALVSVKNAATVLRPKAVISVGTCSGLNPEKSKLGDVVVSAKLATYASKVVTSNQEHSTGMRSYVSKRFLNVIKNCADGWEAPLKDLADAQQVQVHTDAEFLSGPEQVRAEWRRDQLAETNPQAMAIINEGEGE